MFEMFEIFYNLSQVILAPVLVVIYLLFAYSLLETGRLAGLWYKRRSGIKTYLKFQRGETDASFHGYPITAYFMGQPDRTLNEVEVYAIKLMEPVRIATRIAPMLGLIATLIPMGPALMSLAENNVYAMSEHLRTAFTAVILGLTAASLTFWVASVKKRWFAEEITFIEKRMGR